MSVVQEIKQIAPNAKVDINTMANTFNDYAYKYGITTEKRLDAFLAQLAEETDGFRSLVEYASGAAYEGRLDLGNTQPGDGVKFKGRGGIMITGRSNYATVSKELFGDSRLLSDPTILQQPAPAMISSMFYWKTRGCNELADVGDFKGITKKINGGLNGWADRLSYWQRAKIYVSGFFLENPVVSAAAGVSLVALVIVLVLVHFKKIKLK